MAADEVLSIHREVFYRRLATQDYAALKNLYADDYVLVRPDGSVLSKEKVLNELETNALRFTTIDLRHETTRIYGISPSSVARAVQSLLVPANRVHLDSS